MTSASAGAPTASRQRSGLVRMKRIAGGLLALAALLYAAAIAFEEHHPALRYLAAFAEAAMIGAIADWFAVVALFRRPLGLPIPHTAIIPANKARIGRELADFICNNFLGTAQVLDKLRTADPAALLARWLRNPAHAESLGHHATRAARYALDAFDDDRLRQFMRQAVLTRLDKLQVSQITGQVLDVLTTQGRHQALLDELLHYLATVMEDEAVRAKLSEVVAGEVRYLRYVGLDTVAGNVVAKKMVAGVGKIIGEMASDPGHELRQRFDAIMAHYVEQLKTDPDLQARGEAIKHEILHHPIIGDYLQGLWSDVLAWLQADLDQPDSTIRRRIAGAAAALGEQLAGDAAMRQWINDQVLAAAPPAIARYREDIRHYIVGRVEAWNTDDLTEEVERNIGRDLQFVRINGTLVGGLIGLAIFSLTRWIAG